MNTSPVKTINRLVEILDCFTAAQPAWSLAELSAALHVPKSTLHRLLTGMDAHGILRREDGDKRWRLGYRLFIWGSLASESDSLREVARPVMCDLVSLVGETAILTVYQDHEVVCIDMCETSHPVRLRMQVGERRPAHAGASSKALIAFLPEEEIAAIIQDKGLPRLCANTITTEHGLAAELERIRKFGYAESVEETDPGAWGVATPIRNWKGEVVGALGLAGPTQRYSPEKAGLYAAYCHDAAAKISAFMKTNS
ncbi:MAG: IclR family transcriptional regulator [Chloroflexi bacterium]|nr:IclR family transcriptional regulator [Chloroflexota bacterium]